jgi:hypothetical protein
VEGRLRGGLAAVPERPIQGHLPGTTRSENSPLDCAWILAADARTVAADGLLPAVNVPLVVRPVFVVTVHGQADLGAVASKSHRPDPRASMLRPVGKREALEGPPIVRLIRAGHLRSVTGRMSQSGPLRDSRPCPDSQRHIPVKH